MGRPRKPTVLKMAEGNPGHETGLRERAASEPKPRTGLPPCPEHLDAKAKVLWHWLGEELMAMGLVGQVDGLALETLCAVYARILRCREIIAEKGLTYESETEAGGVMIRPRPEVNILAVAEKEYRALLTEFGGTPASRGRTTRLEGGQAGDKSISGFARKRG